MKLLRNDYTANARPRTGYHDFEIVIEFEVESPEERSGAAKALVAVYQKSSMWCTVAHADATTLIIHHGYDSGD